MIPTLVIGRATITLHQGDITAADVDAIVNAANHSLLGGGGVDGAIHRRGGAAVLAECRRLRATAWPDGLPTGRAVLTTGGNLVARHVIHTVGPVYSGNPDVPRLLAACHAASLGIAREHGLRTIAFPAISTGIYGYPLDEAAPIALGTTADELARDAGSLVEVRFVLFDARAHAAFAAALDVIARRMPRPTAPR